MKAAKYVLGLVCLFGVSCAAIVLGYHNSILGFRVSIELAIQQLPILASATFMMLSCPISHVIAFRKYPDDRKKFVGFGLTISFFLPVVLLVFLLPSADDLPGPLSDGFLSASYAVLWLAFIGIYHWLHMDFWRFARREA